MAYLDLSPTPFEFSVAAARAGQAQVMDAALTTTLRWVHHHARRPPCRSRLQ
jgi:pyrimidine deaminase RibD-like protein